MSDEDVRASLKWPDVLQALEQAFQLRYQDAQAFLMPERIGIEVQQGSLLTMPCADQEGWFGVKQVAVMPENPQRDKPSVQAWYTLLDPTGTPALACSATFLTKFRTSAVSALAAKYLALPEAKTLLVVGTGSLAPWMAEAHSQVRHYEKILVWGRDEQKAQHTAEEIAQRCSVALEAIDRLSEGIKQADVITVATTSRRPIIQGQYLRAGQHIDIVGAFIPEMIEVDAETVKRSTVFVDDLQACKLEAGDLIQAQASGWTFDNVKADLAKVVSEKVTRAEMSLFKSVGLALEDLVVAKLLV